MCEEAGAHGENLRVQAGNPHIHSHTTTVDHGLGSNSGRSGDKQVHFKTIHIYMFFVIHYFKQIL